MQIVSVRVPVSYYSPETGRLTSYRAHCSRRNSCRLYSRWDGYCSCFCCTSSWTPSRLYRVSVIFHDKASYCRYRRQRGEIRDNTRTAKIQILIATALRQLRHTHFAKDDTRLEILAPLSSMSCAVIGGETHMQSFIGRAIPLLKYS